RRLYATLPRRHASPLLPYTPLFRSTAPPLIPATPLTSLAARPALIPTTSLAIRTVPFFSLHWGWTIPCAILPLLSYQNKVINKICCSGQDSSSCPDFNKIFTPEASLLRCPMVFLLRRCFYSGGIFTLLVPTGYNPG